MFQSEKQKDKPKKPIERWNYLHDYGKVKKAKLEEKIKMKQQSTEEKEFKNCTFSPKLNRIKKTQATYK